MPTPLQWLAALAGKADMEASWRLPVQTEATKKPFHIPVLLSSWVFFSLLSIGCSGGGEYDQ